MRPPCQSIPTPHNSLSPFPSLLLPTLPCVFIPNFPKPKRKSKFPFNKRKSIPIYFDIWFLKRNTGLHVSISLSCSHVIWKEGKWQHYQEDFKQAPGGQREGTCSWQRETPWWVTCHNLKFAHILDSINNSRNKMIYPIWKLLYKLSITIWLFFWKIS